MAVRGTTASRRHERSGGRAVTTFETRVGGLRFIEQTDIEEFFLARFLS